MNRIHLLPVLLLGMFLTACAGPQTASREAVSKATSNDAFDAVVEMFAAFSVADHEGLRNTVTDDFVLLEHGEVWDFDFLLSVLSPSDTIRTNFFNIISRTDYPQLVTVNYWTKSTFTTGDERTDRYWLESAVLKPVGGRWRVQQLHSTRLEPGVVPEGVEFASFQ